MGNKIFTTNRILNQIHDTLVEIEKCVCKDFVGPPAPRESEEDKRKNLLIISIPFKPWEVC